MLPNPDPATVVYGINPIVELLKAKRRKINKIYTTKPAPKAWADIAKLLPSYVQQQCVTKEQLTRLAGSADHQGVVALAAPMVIQKAPFTPAKQPFVLMLDCIQDPRNLGAMLRSAYCTGVSGVIITTKNSAALHGTALKASAGLAEHMTIYETPTAAAAATALKTAGYNIYLAALDSKAKPITQVDLQLPLCIVIGNEGSGISKSLLSMGTSVILPQRRDDISYNASVATGILLFHIATKHSIL